LLFECNEEHLAERYLASFIAKSPPDVLEQFGFLCLFNETHPLSPRAGFVCIVRAAEHGNVKAKNYVRDVAHLASIEPDAEGEGSAILKAIARHDPRILCALFYLTLLISRPRAASYYLELGVSKHRYRFELQLCEAFEMYNTVPGNRSVIAATLSEMAENGCVMSQMLYALDLMMGRGVRRNPVQAAEYFKKAADGGSLYAQFMSGVNHLYGIGLTRDEEAAIGYFRNVADCLPIARAFLASLFIRRTNLFTRLQKRYQMKVRTWSTFPERCEITNDVGEAIESLKHEAALTNPTNMFMYGFCLELGFGVECNPRRAVELYRMATKNGSLHAMYRLALCLCDGVGSERNLREAILWLRQAADYGYPDAQFDFAMCLEFGCGCPVNHQKSREFLELAADGGNTNAQIVVMASPQNFSQNVQTKFRVWSSILLAGRTLDLDLERERERDRGRAEETISDADRNANELGGPTGWTRFIVAAQQSS
jgi:hypothetical protein